MSLFPGIVTINSDNIYPSLCILIIGILFHRLDINKWASGSRRMAVDNSSSISSNNNNDNSNS